MNRKTTWALGRIAAAVIASVVLLACSGFAFVKLLQDPAQVTEGAELTSGAYIRADVAYLMDICGVEHTESGKAVAYFAVVPLGDQFVLVRFPASEYDTIADLEAQTRSYLVGTLSSPSFHLAVTGTVSDAPEAARALLDTWFTDNAAWMSRSGLIAAVNDYDVYLSGEMIDAGRLGPVDNTAAIVLTVIAAVLAVYAVAEIVALCVKLRRPKPEERDANA